MSEERFKIIENILSASNIYPADCSFIKNSIIALQEKNEQLKETLENNSKINIADHKYASEMEDKYLTEHNILTEFEKWLVLKMEQTKEYDTKNYHNDIKLIISTYKFVLEKLQELKEGNNGKI